MFVFVSSFPRTHFDSPFIPMVTNVDSYVISFDYLSLPLFVVFDTIAH